jgi:hypothetical protein
MAAQERAKQAKKGAPETPPPDIFDMTLPPPSAAGAIIDNSSPPPLFDELTLVSPPPPQEEEAPPAFDLLEETFDNGVKPPPTPAAPYVRAPPTPSAPTFEDLLYGTAPSMADLPPPPMPDEQQQLAEEFDGLEGLTDAEKTALLEEQRKIMEEIERNKKAKPKSSVASAADAFDQRSNAAVARIAGGDNPNVRLAGSATTKRTVKLGDNQEVALHGQERTRAAIAEGTAILTQCVNCNNWMQVTDNATLMFCPVCQVVSPVDRENCVSSKEEALQMEADRKLAEELQKEEYGSAERVERRQRRAAPETQQQPAAAAKKDESWWDWLGLGGGATTTAPTPPQQQSPQYRGDMGVSRPPGAGLQSAQTGTSLASGSYDGEDRALLTRNNGGGVGAARVAESKPLFSCVADSITTAATSFTSALNTQSLTTDDEGNVHGVDGSSLLVVSQAGRNNQNHG